MIRGTRVIVGQEAETYTNMINTFRDIVVDCGYSEIIIPSLWEQETFINKAGHEIMNQMYAFNDKRGRPICLIPEITAIIQELWNGGLCKTVKKPYKIFYVSRAWRYEKPQRGRQREFTQFGVELLGGKTPGDRDEILNVMTKCMEAIPNLNYTVIKSVKRGLSYYIDGDGFEVECNSLGAQKQVAGGGRYKEGIGFAVGVERLLLASGQWK